MLSVHEEPGARQPLVSVIVLNYNGAKWIERCLSSLRAQTIFSQIKVRVADYLSIYGSDQRAEQLVKGWENGAFVQHGRNLGFAEGNNRAAALATGGYLFFLNNDAWLEPACLEQLLEEA